MKEAENDTKNRKAFESVEDMFSDMGIDTDNVQAKIIEKLYKQVATDISQKKSNFFEKRY